MPETLSSQTRPAEQVPWPAVTVITPTLGNRADLLGQVLQAITSQEYPGDIQPIVVLDVASAEGRAEGAPDPGYWDEIRAAATAAGARVVENRRNPGLAGSRNTGIMAAETDFIAFCDDDDFWLPGKLSAQMAALTATPEAVLVCCGITVETAGNVVDRVHPAQTVTFTDLLRSRLTALHVSTFVARRPALVDGIGLVSEEIPGSRAEDYELLLRASRRSPVLNIPEPGVRVLWHTGRQQMYGRWPLVAQALPWLLDHYPEFSTVPVGYARIAGQVAFAHAACGERGQAWRWAIRAIRASVKEPRAYLALAVTCGVKPATIVSALRKRGHGI